MYLICIPQRCPTHRLGTAGLKHCHTVQLVNQRCLYTMLQAWRLPQLYLCFHDQIPQEKQLVVGRVNFPRGIMAIRCKLTGHITSIVREQREVGDATQLAFSFLPLQYPKPWNGCTHRRGILPHLISPIQKRSHRHRQRFIPWVILDFIKLTIFNITECQEN